MAVGESLTSERVSRISNTRWVAPCASLICANTRAAELKGPIIIPAKRTNAKRSPGDTLPSMTWRPPYHNTAAAAEKVRRLMTGINTAMVPARRIANVKVCSTCAANLVSSRCDWTKDFTIRMPEITSSIRVLKAAV